MNPDNQVLISVTMGDYLISSGYVDKEWLDKFKESLEKSENKST